MKVVLKKKILVNKITLNKGEEGWLQAIRMQPEQDEIYFLKIQGHSFVPVKRNDVDFIREKTHQEI